MKVLLVNQTFYPDQAATSQYLTDLAVALAKDGYDVTALCSQRSYLDSSVRHPKKEEYRSVAINRLISFPIPRTRRIFRYLDAALMNIHFGFKLLFFRGFDCVIVMTTPPLISWICALAYMFSRVPVIFWAMDINPDQAVRTGWLRKGSSAERVLALLQRFFLRRFSRVIVLDEFMHSLLSRKGLSDKKIETIPLWSDLHTDLPVRADNKFRKQYELTDHFIVMYSGNHSICHPLETLLEAARLLRDYDNIAFLFVGGGARISEVKSFRDHKELHNIIVLPYQPREFLKHSLSAADLHVVSMGDPYIGVVHPSKVYSILAVGRPMLLLGSIDSAPGSIISRSGAGLQFNHGESERLAEAVLRLSRDAEEIRRLSEHALQASRDFNQKRVISRFEQVISSTLKEMSERG